MIRLTEADLNDAYRRVTSARDMMKGHKGKGEKVAETALTAVEVLAGAGISGLIVGYTGGASVNIGGQNIPLDVVGGAGLHALAFFDVFGKYGSHVHNVANGVLAQYVARVAIHYGSQARDNKAAGTNAQGGNVTPAPNGQAPNGAATGHYGYPQQVQGYPPPGYQPGYPPPSLPQPSYQQPIGYPQQGYPQPVYNQPQPQVAPYQQGVPLTQNQTQAPLSEAELAGIASQVRFQKVA